MSQLIVRLLGPPTVEWEGNFLPVPRRKVRALFFRLALDMQPVARDHLAFLLWCNECDTVAHRDLTHLITHLRNALPDPDLLQSTADFLFLDSRRIWCDTTAFMQLLHRHHAEPTAGYLVEAAGLARGVLLDGFSLDESPEFEEWLTIERSVWEHRHRAVREALVRDSQSIGGSMGDTGLLMHSMHRAAGDDPIDPEVHRQLIEGLLASGDTESVRRILDAIQRLTQVSQLAMMDRTHKR